MRKAPGGDERLANVLLVVGGAFAALLLARQLYDLSVDWARPTLRGNDLQSAVASVAMLVFLGVIAVSRRRARSREAAAAAAVAAQRAAVVKARAERKSAAKRSTPRPGRKTRS
jgi:hypothetical protein